MPRLFSAIVPPTAAMTAVDGVIAQAHVEFPGLRWTPPERRHITLGFFGEDDPHNRQRWLRRRAAGLPAPTLRFAGCGTFPGVLWMGVEPDGDASDAALARLARAAGAGRRGFRAHLTVARWKRGGLRPDRAELLARVCDAPGPWFTPVEVTLMRSDIDHTGPTYTVLDRVHLTA